MDLVGYVAGLFTLVAYLPQTIRTIKTRKTQDLSFWTFLIISTSAILWAIYGIGTNKPAIWITNGVVAICSTTIIIMKLRFG